MLHSALYGIHYFLLCFFTVLLIGLRQSDALAADQESVRVVCTTGMIADLLANIAPPHFEVKGLMGPGVDPHLYKATQGDLRRLASAGIIFYNGHYLEGPMAEVLGRFSGDKPAIALAELLPAERLRPIEGTKDEFDPHVWFDVKLWMAVGDSAADELSKFAPKDADIIQKRWNEYRDELEALDTWVVQQLAAVPESRRILVTAHDAFGYFGERYGFRVVGLQGVSTLTEFGLSDIARVSAVVVDNKIPAVFVESSVPKRFVEALQEGVRAKGYDLSIGEPLFSDAMGQPGTEAGTYLGMVRHNVQSIVEGLGDPQL